jgi:hypothetical protein
MELEREARTLAMDHPRDEAVRRLVEFAEGELTRAEAGAMVDRWVLLQQPGADEAWERYLRAVEE